MISKYENSTLNQQQQQQQKPVCAFLAGRNNNESSTLARISLMLKSVPAATFSSSVDARHWQSCQWGAFQMGPMASANLHCWFIHLCMFSKNSNGYFSCFCIFFKMLLVCWVKHWVPPSDSHDGLLLFELRLTQSCMINKQLSTSQNQNFLCYQPADMKLDIHFQMNEHIVDTNKFIWWVRCALCVKSSKSNPWY